MVTIRNIHSLLDKWVSRLENLFVLFACLLILTMVTIITMSVAGRFFFNSPFAWTVEVSEYIMLFITFFTASWILRQAGHVKLDLLVSKLNVKIQKILNVVTLFLGLAVSSVLSWFALLITLDFYERNVILLKLIHMPHYLVILPILIGSILLSVRFIVSILSEVTIEEK